MILLKNFKLKDIIISEDYKNTQPGNRKMERAELHYLLTRELPTNIVINDAGVLIDGYITYLMAVKYGVEKLDVYRGYVETVEAVHHLFSRKRYAWRVPFRLVGKIKVGDYVIVPSPAGAQRVRVVNVIRQQYPDQEIGKKSLLKKCREDKKV